MKRPSVLVKSAGEVVKILELEAIPVPAGTGDAIRFRVEVMRKHNSKTMFAVRIYRKEFYRIRPTFPQANGKLASSDADELLLVEDSSVIPNVDELCSRSIGAIVDKVLCAISMKFNLDYETKRHGGERKSRPKR